MRPEVGGEIPLLVSAATEDGGDEADGGLEDDEAKFNAPFESILIGESCFLLVGERRFLGLPLELDEVVEDVDEAELKEGVMEMLGAIVEAESF